MAKQSFKSPRIAAQTASLRSSVRPSSAMREDIASRTSSARPLAPSEPSVVAKLASSSSSSLGSAASLRSAISPAMLPTRPSTSAAADGFDLPVSTMRCITLALRRASNLKSFDAPGGRWGARSRRSPRSPRGMNAAWLPVAAPEGMPRTSCRGFRSNRFLSLKRGLPPPENFGCSPGRVLWSAGGVK